MKKAIVLSIFILSVFAASAQNKVAYAWARTTDTAYTKGSWLLDSVMRAKYYASSDTNKVLGVDANGYFRLRTKTSGSSFDTSTLNLTSRFAQKVNYSDTASMLLPYLRNVDTSTLSNRINEKLNITDTANMRLRPIAGANMTISGTYPNITFASSGGGGSPTDTSSLSTRIDARVKYTDTASMLSPYYRTATATAALALKQNNITLTTVGTSGASTLVGSTLNIPNYAGGGGTIYDSVVMATVYGVDTGKARLTTSISTKQPQLSGTGFVKATGTTISYDNSTYLTTSSAASTYAPKASPTFTGTVTIPTGANITTPNILSLTSGTTNDSLVVADPSTGALKRISSARISAGGGSGWGLTGNSGLSSSTNFIGNTDGVDMNIRVSNVVVAKFAVNDGISIGSGSNASGIASVALGVQSISSGIAGISLGYQASNNSVNNGIALGRLCQVNHEGSFVSQDYSGSNALTSDANHQWKAKFNGGYKFMIGTSSATDLLKVGVDAGKAMEITSTTGGFLPPRVTTTQKNAIASPAAGLIVFDTTLGKLCVFTTTWETITSL